MTGKNPKIVAVGMSGGVDSSVAAYLLKQQGYDVIGVTMKIWEGGGEGNKEFKKSGCYGPGEAADIEAAQKVAKQLGIPHRVLDLRDEYEQMVMKYFRDEYLAGKTPNPCVVCNQKIKFGFLLDKALQSGIDFDFFATGHYARTRIDTDFRKHGLTRTGTRLLKAIDTKKDQTYFLYRLTQEQLSKTLFPLGSLLKDDVKKMALEIGLKDVADKAESQDFYDGTGYADFFDAGDSQPGDIIDISGSVVGRHNGVIHYTIGQRKGLNIGGLKEPLYVITLDSKNNLVIVGPREKLMAKILIADDLNWISSEPPPPLLSCDSKTRGLKATAKIRSTQPEKSCTVIPFDEHKVEVDFDEPQMAVTPGQSIVFYDGDLVLGGGVIQRHL